MGPRLVCVFRKHPFALRQRRRNGLGVQDGGGRNPNRLGPDGLCLGGARSEAGSGGHAGYVQSFAKTVQFACRERKRKLRVVKGRVRNESPNEICPGGNHDRLRDTASCRCPARRCELPCCRGFGPGPELHQDRIRDLEDRPEHRRCQHHHAAELPALGEGGECRRRDHALRQAGSGRDRRVRRPQQLGGGGQGRRAPRHPGQGRLHPLALGYRAQPRRRADHEPPRLSASRSHDQSPTGRRSWPRAGPNASFWLGPPSDISHLVRGCADQDEGARARSAPMSP